MHHSLEPLSRKNVEQDDGLLPRGDAGQFRRLVKTPARQQLAVVAGMHEDGFRREGHADHRVLFEDDPVDGRFDLLRRTTHGQRGDAQERLVLFHVIAQLGQQRGDASGKRRGDFAVTFRRQNENRGDFERGGHVLDGSLLGLQTQVGGLLFTKGDRTAVRRAAARFFGMIVARAGAQRTRGEQQKRDDEGRFHDLFPPMQGCFLQIRCGDGRMRAGHRFQFYEREGQVAQNVG